MSFDFEAIRLDLRTRFPAHELARVEESLRYVEGTATPEPQHPLQESSRLYFPGLTAKAWHEVSDTPWVRAVEAGAARVKEELAALMAADTRFLPYEDPYTLELGWKGWDTFSLYRKGRRNVKNCARCPYTADLIATTPRGVRQAMFTKLTPGAHLSPHSGGINVLLTCHLGLTIPEGCGIRVGDETRQWTEGKCLLFDDSFVHEAWNRGDSERVILLWDVWHPDLTATEVAALEYLFPVFDRLMRGATQGGARQESLR